MKQILKTLNRIITVVTVVALSTTAFAARSPQRKYNPSGKSVELPSMANFSIQNPEAEYEVQPITAEQMDATVQKVLIAGDGTDVSHTGRRSAWQKHVGGGWQTFTQTTVISEQRMYEWVDRASWVLRQAAGEAMVLYQSGGSDENNYVQAIGVIVEAFRVLSGSMKRTQYYMGPMTKLLIDRGTLVTYDLIEFSDILNADRFTKVGVLNFLFALIDTILATEKSHGFMGSAEFDKMKFLQAAYGYGRDFFDCGRHGHRSCGQYDDIGYQELFKELEYRFVRLANEELQITNKLIEVHAEKNGRHGLQEHIYELGPAEIYLIAAEHFTQWAAMDVMNSLHGAKYTCVGGALTHLHEELYRFNKAGGSSFGNNVQYMMSSTMDIISTLKRDVLSKDSFDQVKRKYRPSFFGQCRY